VLDSGMPSFKPICNVVVARLTFTVHSVVYVLRQQKAASAVPAHLVIISADHKEHVKCRCMH
jgi:hypothetical protein